MKLRTIGSSYRILAITFASVFYAALSVFMLPAWASGSGRALCNFIDDRANPSQRVLNFPNDFSLGLLTIAQDPLRQALRQIPAKGTVIVPRGSFVTFVPTARFYENPTILQDFPADAFDRIEVTFLSMDDREDMLCDNAVRAIANFTELSQQCSISKCGKSVRVGRPGTMTAWIYADSNCACASELKNASAAAAQSHAAVGAARSRRRAR